MLSLAKTSIHANASGSGGGGGGGGGEEEGDYKSISGITPKPFSMCLCTFQLLILYLIHQKLKVNIL